MNKRAQEWQAVTVANYETDMERNQETSSEAWDLLNYIKSLRAEGKYVEARRLLLDLVRLIYPK